MTLEPTILPAESVVPESPREQTRAMYPDTEGYIERDGVRIFYEVYGSLRDGPEGPSSGQAGGPTILFCPTWTLVHSRVWKMQIPYLARHHRVIVFDPRGNGRSDRPRTREAYAEKEFAQDALDILDATGTEQAFVVGLSRGTQRALLLAAEHPERVLGLVLVGPFFPVARTLASLKWRLMASPLAAPLALREPISTPGVGQVQRPLHPPQLPRVRRVVRGARHPGAAQHQGFRRHGRMGPGG